MRDNIKLNLEIIEQQIIKRKLNYYLSLKQKEANI